MPKDNTILIELYKADNCGFCIQFIPTWDELQQISIRKDPNGDEIHFIYDTISIADYSKPTPSMIQKGITGFPSIYITANGKKIKYRGERKISNIIDAALEFYKDGTIVIDPKQLKGGSVNNTSDISTNQIIDYFKNKYYKYKTKYKNSKHYEF